MYNNIHIPERFVRAITLHLIKNLISDNITRAPLLLGIHGPSGDGKTFQCEYALHQMGVKTFLISGGQFENREAGEPAHLVRTMYLNAGQCIRKKESLCAVVLINDIDTGLGSWGEQVQYTINRQTVFGELMHLVDYPTQVEGRNTIRIPIIITGNDFSRLYKPLVRAGRMTSFEWSPTVSEKTNIVKEIFPELNEAECEMLVREFNSQQIAFFSHLKTTLVDDILWNDVKKIDIEKVIDYISSNQPVINLDIHYKLLIEAGRRLLQSGRLVNHLRSK